MEKPSPTIFKTEKNETSDKKDQEMKKKNRENLADVVGFVTERPLFLLFILRQDHLVVQFSLLFIDRRFFP